MSNTKSTATASASVGLPVFTLVVAVLFVLKVAAINGASWGLDISWWLVFAPWLVGLGITITFLAVFIFIAFIVAVFGK